MTDSKDLIERLRDGLTLGLFHPILNEAADALTDLEARLRIETKRAEDAEARNDFLMTELDNLIEKARQT